MDKLKCLKCQNFKWNGWMLCVYPGSSLVPVSFLTLYSPFQFNLRLRGGDTSHDSPFVSQRTADYYTQDIQWKWLKRNRKTIFTNTFPLLVRGISKWTLPFVQNKYFVQKRVKRFVTGLLLFSETKVKQGERLEKWWYHSSRHSIVIDISQLEK